MWVEHCCVQDMVLDSGIWYEQNSKNPSALISFQLSKMIVIVVDIQHAVTVGQTLFQVLYVLTYSILKGVLGSSLQLGQGEVKELGQRHSYRVGLGFGPPGLSLPATQCS